MRFTTFHYRWKINDIYHWIVFCMQVIKNFSVMVRAPCLKLRCYQFVFVKPAFTTGTGVLQGKVWFKRMVNYWHSLIKALSTQSVKDVRRQGTISGLKKWDILLTHPAEWLTWMNHHSPPKQLFHTFTCSISCNIIRDLSTSFNEYKITL
jgi:hypothetical protein